MSYISTFFGWIFDWINGFTNNYGVTIILFTILFRLILSPFDIRSRIGQREYSAKMKKIQPEIDRINQAYKNDPQKAQARIMEVRKQAGIGIMPKGCGMMLLTYPILIAFFAVFRNLAAEHLAELAQISATNDQAQIAQWFGANGFLWVKNIWQPDVLLNFREVWGLKTLWIIKDINGDILPQADAVQSVLQSAFNGGLLAGYNPNGLELADFAAQVGNNLTAARDYVATAYGSGAGWLGGNGYYIFPILAGVVQVLSLKFTPNQQPEPAAGTKAPGAGMGKIMKIFFPALFIYFCLVSSTALAIYWITSSLCMLLLTFIINKVLDEREKKKNETSVVEGE